MALATWQGPFAADVYSANGKTRLEIGDTYEVGDTELQSAHWEAVRGTKPQPPEPPTTPTISAPTDNATDGATD